MRRLPTAALGPLLALAGGCQLTGGPGEPAGDGAAVSSRQQAIIGGTVDQGDPAVVQYGGCTGTMVADTVVLTAAHCVSDRILAGRTSGGAVRFGTGDGDFIGTVDIVDMTMHRRYDAPAFTTFDIALLRTQGALPDGVEPLAINADHLDESFIGLSVRVVGFGHTDGVAQTGAGTKRKVDLTVDELTGFHIGAGTPGRNTCQGDSGGPSIARFGDEERVVAVTSFGSDACRSRSYMSRTDIHMDEFLLPVIDAWSGPCKQDGVCVETGCRTPDPDCDPCGFDGTCAQGCPQVDLDCPLGGLDGEFCDSDVDCESRHCIESRDDPRIRYCSRTCDPALTISCTAPLGTCEPYEGAFSCFFVGTTPGAQGSFCESGATCRSGLCDTGENMCVEPCGDGQPECGEDFQCRGFGDGKACRVPAGGLCSTGGSGGSPWLVAAALMAVLGRRRRQ